MHSYSKHKNGEEKNKKTKNCLTNAVKIESLDNNAQGVARIDINDSSHIISVANSNKPFDKNLLATNQAKSVKAECLNTGSTAKKSTKKVIFIEGALPGERVEYKISRDKTHYAQAIMTKLVVKSWQRMSPKCQFFGVCGGCNMQHLDISGQTAVKQRFLEDALRHIGKVQVAEIYRPIVGFDWKYRLRAKLSVQYLPKTNSVLVGFFKRKTSVVTDMQSCEVLPTYVSNLIKPLRLLIAQLSIKDQINFIEVAINEKLTVLNFNLQNKVKLVDQQKITAFAQQHHINIWLQYKNNFLAKICDKNNEIKVNALEKQNADTNYSSQLFYKLPQFDITIFFQPGDFTQVNPVLNRQLVQRAVQLLNLKSTDNVLDMFCGLGNFTLPIGRLANKTLGIEGDSELIKRALSNRAYNHLNHCVDFICLNLFEFNIKLLKSLAQFNKLLLDPPREGAYSIVKTLAEAFTCNLSHCLPERIVYISCNPSSLARDANVLVNQAHYELAGTGIINMFPHTSHVESIAVFDLKT